MKAFHTPEELEFCAEFSDKFSKRFSKKNYWLFSTRGQIDHIISMLTKQMTLTAKEKTNIRHWISEKVHNYLSFGSQKIFELKYKDVDIRLARPEPHRAFRLEILESLHSRSDSEFQEMRYINDLVLRLEQITDIDTLLAGISDAERKINRYYKKN